MKTALVIGATGLVGGEMVNILLESKEYSRVVVFVRRQIPLENEKLEQHLIDFDKIESYKEYIKGNDFFSCMGTTIKQAKTKENFTKVDLTYPSVFAEMAKSNGIEKFMLTSSIGANPKSSNFYLRTKGLLEEKLKELQFPATYVFRPCFLAGKRQKVRWSEKMGGIILSVLSPFLIGKLRKFRTIEAKQVAKAMYQAAQANMSGFYTYESDEISQSFFPY